MKGFIRNIEEAAQSNSDFRKVLYTAKHSQLVLMSLKPKEEIGMEIHADNDQFFRVEAGTGMVIIDGVSHPIKDGDVIIIPAGSEHNVINTSAAASLQLYTLYSPPHHRDGVVHQTKRDAEADHEEFEGVTTE